MLIHYCIEIIVKDGRRFQFLLKDISGQDRCNQIKMKLQGLAFTNMSSVENNAVNSNTFTSDYYQALIKTAEA